jgi:membrane protein YqaA with SNARE-associated domain
MVKIGKLRNAELFLIVTVSFCIVMYFLLHYNVFPALTDGISTISNTIKEFGVANGLWAALLISFFGNTSILIVVPYAYVVWQIAYLTSLATATTPQVWFPIILGIISGLGAGVGEFTSYVIGRLFSKSKKLVSTTLGQRFENMRQIFERHPKSIPFIVYIFAVTPLPDDVILIPFGVMKYSYWKTVIPCMLGKMTMCILIACAAYFIGPELKNIPIIGPIIGFLMPSETSDPANEMLSLLPLFVIVYLMIRIDFGKLLERKGRNKGKVEESVPASAQETGEKKILENEEKTSEE